MNPYIKEGDNNDITKERKKASFNVEKMSEFYYNGKEKLKMRREVEKYIESRKELLDSVPVAFLNREELIDNGCKKFLELTKHDEMFDLQNIEKAHYFGSLVHVRDSNPFSLHYVMFLPVLQSQSSDEQNEKWFTLALSRSINGTYAQTEMGHGTNLSKLETTATYDPKSQEFVLHTPRISAAKWWPGNLGKFANYAIVVAILYTNGECKGPHPFLVQIRDLDSHKVLPNIRVGDIGPKYGINGSDNGYLIFDHYRIPRENMLMRHSKVLEDGTYIKPPHSKLAFGGMVFVRSMMVRDIANHLAIATTIATRYSCVRRQGEINPGNGEVQILDYQTQQLRIFPLIAKAIAFRFAGQNLRDVFAKISKQLFKGNATLLPELHALSSGLKAVVTFEVQQGIEQCRLACGGHGYSEASALPELFRFSCGSCTYEGDNIVLLLQVSKFLMKAVDKIRMDSNSELADICEYLKRTGSQKSQMKHYQDYEDTWIIEDFENIARKQIFKCYDKLKKSERDMKKENAWNSCSIELCKASRWHVRLYIVRNFLNKIKCSPLELQRVLHNLSRLYVFEMMVSCSGSFIEDDYMSFEQISEIKDGLYYYLAALRSDAVSIVDSFCINEIELRSVLGKRDGNVYQALLEWAQKSPLNKQEVSPNFEKFGNLLNSGFPKFREIFEADDEAWKIHVVGCKILGFQ